MTGALMRTLSAPSASHLMLRRLPQTRQHSVFGEVMEEQPISTTKWAVAALCLWIPAAWFFDLSLAITIGIAAGIFLVSMLPELWWSERAHRSMRRESNLRAAREREYSRARQRERGD